jgi:hypothetical protein
VADGTTTTCAFSAAVPACAGGGTCTVNGATCAPCLSAALALALALMSHPAALCRNGCDGMPEVWGVSLPSDALAIDSYFCTCAAGYEGTNCAADIDECQPNPCKVCAQPNSSRADSAVQRLHTLWCSQQLLVAELGSLYRLKRQLRRGRPNHRRGRRRLQLHL